jgi:5-methylphenazine-1-carboxylate 1-monooxygenase
LATRRTRCTRSAPTAHRRAIIDAHVLADELSRDFPEGLATYEKTRRAATAAVIAANREMRPTGDKRSPEDLARVTATYRRVTDADN